MALTILIDVDGVLADFSSVFLSTVRKVTGRSHTLDEVTQFDFAKCIVTPEEAGYCWTYLQRFPELIEGLPAYPYAGRLLTTLRARGRVVACTAPAGDWWYGPRYRWLTRAGFTARDIVFTSDKSMVDGDFLIDDSVDNLTGWAAKHEGLPILVNRPWNRDLTPAQSFLDTTRCTLDQIPTFVRNR